MRKLYWPIQVLGWGVPALFLGLTMGITGVSFRLGDVCLPNQENSYVTYMGWLMGFACLAGLLQAVTTAYCAWIYLRDVLRGGGGPSTNRSMGYTGGGRKASAETDTIGTQGTRAKVTWNRMKRVIRSQWRSIGLCVLLVLTTTYYGGIFTEQARLVKKINNGTHDDRVVEWATCLVLNGLDPNKCRGIPSIIRERAFLASFTMSGLLGMLCSLLLFRKSMLEGWAYIFRHGKLPPREDDGAFIIARSETQQLNGTASAEKSPVVEQFAKTPYSADEHGLQSPVGTVYTARERRASETSMV